MNRFQRVFTRRNNNNSSNNSNFQNSRNNNGTNSNFQNNRNGPNRFQRRLNFESANSNGGSGSNNNWRSRDNRPRRNVNRQRSNNRIYDRNQNDNRNNTERWYKVVVLNSSRLEPFYVVNAIQQEANFEFTPFNYSVNGNCVEFYVQGDDLSYSIKSLSKRISAPDGMKLLIRTEKAALPQIDCTPEFVEKLKITMSKRYNLTSKFLNLSQLSTEEDFLSTHHYVSLNRMNVCKEVVKIIIENIPDLVSIDLSNNKIQSLEPFKPLVTVCKNLKILNLNNNNVNNIVELDVLKGLDIETLNIDFNPFKKNLKDRSQENYVRLIRQRFPKVINLDGVSIPPPISFDVEEPTTLPETKESCIPDHLREFVADFVKNYFTLFDSDNRQSLLDLYYEQANFSFTINKFDRKNKLQKNIDSNLLIDSRNLLRISDNQCSKLIRQGKASVVSALSNLPKTEHILPSLKIDVPLFHSNFIVININGLYKSKRPYCLKAFSRNFLIASHNNSYAIVNDLFSITSPTVDNINFVKNLYKNDPNQDVNFMESMDEFAMYEGHHSNNFQSGSVSHNNTISSTINSPSNSMISSMNQGSQIINQIPSNQELINRFSNITGMNLQFSKQCLEEYNYNAGEALKIFKTLKEQNSIPPQAFQ